MPRGERTIQRYSPDFVISAGTQVVLKASKALAGGEEHKKPGSVGVVVESPPSNEHPYIVQFADGQTVKAFYRELALRRQEVDAEPSEVSEDLRQFVIGPSISTCVREDNVAGAARLHPGERVSDLGTEEHGR